ncbi:MAG: hypothetical protein ABEN55_16620, partial [Bradymonadaceae bacterium]
HRAFPQAQHASIAWSSLADWFERNGHPKLASDWRSRAAAADESLWHEVWSRSGSWIDTALLLFVTFALVFLGYMIVLGARGGRRVAIGGAEGMNGMVGPF